MARQEGTDEGACSEEGAARELWLQQVSCDRLSMARQEGAGEGACSEGGAARELWLQPCAEGELGAALYSNAAFAALKCMTLRTPDGHVGIAVVVRLRPRYNCLKKLWP